MYQDDVHTIAERFLRDIEHGKTSFYAPSDNPDIRPFAELVNSDLVTLWRKDVPRYLVGFKASGTPVFTHDARLAASFDSASLKLIDALRVLKFHQIPVETMPACWFSSFQGE